MAPTGVLLMTFGSAATKADVPAYMASVRGGKPAPDDLVREFQRRYEVIGFSPLVKITQSQATALEALLNQEGTPDDAFLVRAGMRHSPPYVADAVAELGTAGVRRVIAIVLSPQYSPIIMGGYNRAVEAAKGSLPTDCHVTVAGAWHLSPNWIATLALRVREAIERLPEHARDTAPVIFTAHSLPKSVVDREPEFIEQLRETVRAVAEESGLLLGRWLFAYQSAGHTPEEWLKPDLKDLLPGIRAQGHTHVLVAPVQFLADHLEILYDIDIAAREEAQSADLAFSRIEMPNTMPLFIRALAEVVHNELEASVARPLV
jgi:ferrochelatase